jgi:3-hydroxypropanoate dehydrogenase
VSGKAINNQALDQLFLKARTQNAWKSDPVSEELLRQVYDLTKMAPTSANGCPARFVMLTSVAARQRLQPLLAGNNAEKMMAAPVNVIIGHDMAFYDKLPQLFPAGGEGYKAYFAGNEALAAETAFRNGSMQGAYFIMAARALGLDCGPISGFNNAGVDAEFFAGTTTRSNFICAVGLGHPSGAWPRNPRLSFEEACQLL